MNQNSTWELSPSVEPPKDTSRRDDDQIPLKEQIKLYNTRYQTDTTLRTCFSYWVILLDTFWLLGVLRILMDNTKYFQISDSVLITLLGTTTINVLGLAFIILKGLFYHKESKGYLINN